MRRQIVPPALAIGVGIVVLAHQFIANPFLDALGATLTGWGAFLAACAVLLGIFNLLTVHWQGIARRDGNSWTSAVILLTALVVFLVVLPSGGASPASGWVLRYLYQPLEASFLALIVFFLASASFRALRVRTWDTALLVAAALVVLIGAAPLSGLLSPVLPALKEWVLDVPTVAGVRGILFGVALGTILTGLRLLTGIDRPYSE